MQDLPPFAITKDGQKVDLTGDIWAMRWNAGLSSNRNLNWTNLRMVKINGTRRPLMSDRAVHHVKMFTAHRMSTLLPSSINGILKAVFGFARWLAENPRLLPHGRCFDWSDLTAEMFAEWVKTEHSEKRKGDYARVIRSFYLWCADSDDYLSDFSKEVAKAITQTSLQSRAAGEVVESRDKRRGPFSREELELILEACETGKGNDHDRAITWVFLCTAARPQQLALLRRRDLQIFDKNGENEGTDLPREQHPVFQLKVRKIKKQHTDPEYHFLPLSEGCGRLLCSLIPPEEQLDAPLFWWIGADYEQSIRRSLREFFEAADLMSPRLPLENAPPQGPFFERMPVFPRRFRYGLATDRIAQGDTPDNVAEFLGHSSTNYVKVYTETTPLIADQMQRATDHAVLPLVRRFYGRIDDPAQPSNAPLIPAILPPFIGKRSLKVLGNLGKCDAELVCPHNPVTSCFGCPSFIARPDAPLRELRDLMAEALKDLGGMASPTVANQLGPVLSEIDQWVEHIDRSKGRAAIDG